MEEDLGVTSSAPGASTAAASRSREGEIADSVRRLVRIVDLYDRVHIELDDGKAWEDINHGLRQEGTTKITYEHWASYLQQRIVIGARELSLISRLQPAAAAEPPGGEGVDKS